jgi:hypothetical protein
MNTTDRAALVAAVQANCHIADARYATDMTLCTYLLQMREFYRWEQTLPFAAPLVRANVGAWIAERESLWSRVEDQSYQALPCAGRWFEPFDVDTVNDLLRPFKLLYGAGLIGAGQPVFFLADLHSQSVRDGLVVRVAGREHARGLLTPPAALVPGSTAAQIELRREALERWCWQKFESFSLRKTSGSALEAAVQAYGLDRGFDAALPRWLDEQSEVMMLHELGEYRAGLLLGTAWAEMRLTLSRRADVYARAVRDHMADLSVTLPALIEQQATASIHLWFASYDGVRAQLFPSLTAAYHPWRLGDGDHALRRAIDQGRQHFTRLAQSLVGLQLTGQGPDIIEQRLLSNNAVFTA